MSTYFIADLHLSATRPEINELFVDFLERTAGHCDALYILGDLFDYWIGDDDLNDFHLQIIQALKQFTDAGTPCYFIAGNRDFLIGKGFSQLSGVTLLPEHHVIQLYGVPVLLLHGDTLCTFDVSYQRFRRIIRHPWLLKLASALPLSWRRAIAHKLRSSSKTQRTLTSEQLAKMDVNPAAVEAAFKQFHVDTIIHGHTHKPRIHQHDGGERIVLGDWYEQGSCLEVNDQQAVLQSFQG